MGWLLSFFGFCQHEHYRRERNRVGALLLVCDDCGRTVPAIQRTNKERRDILRRFAPVGASKASRVNDGKVTPMPKRRAK